MISIGSNVSDLILQKTLSYNTVGLNNAIERMTTGYKVNHAKDNAATYSMIADLSKKISSMLQVQQNTEDGIDLLMTAEGGMSQMHELLERLRELTTQAANGTYGDRSRESLQNEADQIIEEISRIKSSIEYNGMNLYETPREDTAQTNSIQTFSMAKSAPMRTAAAQAATIEGAVDFNNNETKIVTIDGVDYTITNRAGNASSISYVKDTQSGEITFLGNMFEIRGDVNVAHNIAISGNNIIVYGGNLDDNIKVRKGMYVVVYGMDGNDTLTLEKQNTSVTGNALYGGNGDDILNLYTVGSANGQAGNDIFNIDVTGTSTLYGGIGNDTFNIIRASNSNIYGEDGDDHFNLITSNQNTINGGSGNNTISGNTANNNLVNVPSATAYEIIFNRKEIKTVTINNIDYTIEHLVNSTGTLMYSIEADGTINFFKSISSFNIEGAKDKAHKVKFNIGGKFYGGDLDDIISTSGTSSEIHGGKGDDTIMVQGHLQSIFGEDGNDTITIDGSRAFIDAGNGNDIINWNNNHTGSILCGTGDDTVNIKRKTQYPILIDGGNGNNIINDTFNNTPFLNGFGDADNCIKETFAAGETKEIEINGIKYTVKNRMNSNNTFFYSYNNVTDEISLGGYSFDVIGQEDVQHNVILYGVHMYFYGGELDDKILSNMCNGYIYAGNGNDTIVQKSNQTQVYCGDGDDIVEQYSGTTYGGNGNDIITIYGGDSAFGEAGDDIYYVNSSSKINDTSGDNIYYINIDNGNISGGVDNDTFYINGNNNTVLGGGGNDYFVIDGENNTVDGGTGDNFYVDNSSGTNMSNVNKDPNSGGLSFSTLGEVKTFTLNNKTYTVTNNFNGNNMLQFSLNPNTGVITLQGDNLTIDAQDNQTAILNIRGSNNTINGSNLDDKITIELGTNNVVHGKNGNDSLISNSENNSIFGDSGNDTITLNASSNMEINGGDGNDTININSSNNTNINSGNGNDRIVVNGENNTVNTNDGDNNITINNNSNTIKAGNGNNRITTVSDDNIIIAGSGNNILGIQGNGNSVNAKNAAGDININGENNDVTVNKGDNSINIKGDSNTFTSLSGEKEFNINGNSNNISTGNGNDEFTIKGNNNTIETTGGHNSISIRGNENNYQGGDGIDDVKISGNNNTALGGGESDSFLVSSGNGNIIDGEGGSRNTIINNGVQTTFSNAVDITPRPFELNLNVDICTTDDKFISTKISFNLFDFSLDFSTTESAAEGLEKIDELLANLDKEMTNIGSVINRLESVLEAQTTKLNTMISTRSTLQDADVAKESSSFIRYQILQQATASLMSSSRNIRSENIMNLLYGINS